MEKLKIYISGPITYNPNWKEEFKKAEEECWNNGYFVMSPRVIAESVEEQIKNPKYADYMKSDILSLMICDVVYMLKNWEKSKGARIEHDLAEVLGLKIIYQ